MKNLVSLIYIFSICIGFSYAQPAKRIMLEEFTGTWCGGCPEGTLRGEILYSNYPQECIQLAWHRLDSLTIPEDYTLQSRFGINSYPTALFNRYRNFNYQYNPLYTLWATNYSISRNIPAIATVSFSDMERNGSLYTTNVNVEFYSLPENGIPLKINIILIEDSIPATGILEQTNYSSAIENGNDPLLNWKHNAVVRKTTNGIWGTGGAIPQIVTLGTVYSQHVDFTVDPSWNTTYMHAIAYVAYDQDTTLNHAQILNSEIIRLDDFISTNISDPVSQNKISVFPNPVRTGQTICIAYQLERSTETEITVLNSSGVLVSKPFYSYETAGMHTFLWSSDKALSLLAKGSYFVNVKLKDGTSFSQKFILE